MSLNDEQHAYVVEQVTQILKSANRSELLAQLKERVLAEAKPASPEELDEIVLAVAEAVSELVDEDPSC